MKFTSHDNDEISPKCLGPEWEQAITDFIDEKVTAIGLDFYSDPKTGEIDSVKLGQFKQQKHDVRRAAVRKVNSYFRDRGSYRKKKHSLPRSMALLKSTTGLPRFWHQNGIVRPDLTRALAKSRRATSNGTFVN